MTEDDNIALLLSKVLLTLTSESTVYVSSFKLIIYCIYWYKIRSKAVNSCFFQISIKSLELRKLWVEKDLVFNASNIHKSHTLIDLLTFTGSLRSEY